MATEAYRKKLEKLIYDLELTNKDASKLREEYKRLFGDDPAKLRSKNDLWHMYGVGHVDTTPQPAAPKSRAQLERERQEAIKRYKHSPGVLKREAARKAERDARQAAQDQKLIDEGKMREYYRARHMRRHGMKNKDLRKVHRRMDEISSRVAERRDVVAGRGKSRGRVDLTPKKRPPAANGGYTPLYDRFADVEATPRTVLAQEAEAHSTVVARYLRRVGAAFKDEDQIKITAGKMASAVNNFFNTVATRNPLTQQERRLIDLAIEKGPTSLSEGEKRLVITAIAHSDDTESMLELARRYDPNVKLEVGQIDMMRLRRFIVGNVLGEKGDADLQRVAKAIRDRDVSPVTEAARRNIKKNSVVRAMLGIGEDPVAAAYQSDQAVKEADALRQSAGVAKLNPGRVQHQVTVDGRQLGFDSVRQVSVEELLHDRQLPLHQRRFSNIMGYTTEDLKKMRASGIEYVGLGVKGGDTAELHILEGFGADGAGKRINLVYQAGPEQVNSLLAVDADKVVMIDSENTFGMRVRDPNLDSTEIDQLAAARADQNFKQWMKKLLHEHSENDAKYQHLSPEARQAAISRDVARAIANNEDDDLSRLRSLTAVTASRRERHAIAEANMADMVVEKGNDIGGRLFGTEGRVVGLNFVDLDKLRKQGKHMEVGTAYADYIDFLERKVKQGYVVEGFNPYKADLSWLRRDAYKTANEIISQYGDNADARRLANRLLQFTGSPTLDKQGEFVWGEFSGIDRNGVPFTQLAGADQLLLNTRDVQKDIRAMLPASYMEKGKFVRGYDMGDGLKVSLADLMSDKALKPIVEEDFRIMYGAHDDVVNLVKGISVKEGLTGANKALQTSFQTEEELIAYARDLASKTTGDQVAEIARRWKDSYHGQLRTSLSEGAGASAEELYVLFRHLGQMPDEMKGTLHEALPDAMRQVFYYQRARETFQKTGRIVVRTLEDRSTGRLNNAVNAIKNFVASVEEPVKVMLTEPREGAKGAYLNTVAYVRQIFSGSEPVTSAHKMQMAAAQLAAYGSESVDSVLHGADIGEAAKAARGVVDEVGNVAQAGLYAARQRKAVTAAAAVGIAVAAGTAIRRRRRADESWRYGPTWSAQEEREHTQRLNDPGMGRLAIETSNRRSNHHNMKSDRHKHLFGG